MDENQESAAGQAVIAGELKARVDRLLLLHRVGIALGAEKNIDRLLEMILLEAQKLCRADGGTLYLRGDDDTLHFAIMRTASLEIALGGTTGKPIDLPGIRLFDDDGAPNTQNVASYAANRREVVNIPDVYDAAGFDFSGTKGFDAHNGYRSTSILTVPMIGNGNELIGVLQLLNAGAGGGGEVLPFAKRDQEIVEALAAQAGIALANQLALDGQKELLESFIRMIASAIDSKSPYTGGHCERVPVLTEMLAQSVCDDETMFADFNLTDEEWYELRIAAWMHDCGKITTPVHVMDKATKLETIHDRMHEVRARFEIKRRDLEIEKLQAEHTGDDDAAQAALNAQTQLDTDLAFLEKANIGGEFLPDNDKARIVEIAKQTVQIAGVLRPLLDDEEVKNLSISRGTLTGEERLIINGHMVETIKMLTALPFPRHLRRVPEYAGGHHEKMDGGGYPKGIYAGEMSLPARMMAIADVFEALTAQDRPYKKGKTLSESMRIMGFMKQDNHLDPDLFDHFVKSGVYRTYATKYLPDALIDDVDEDALLRIQPKPFEPAAANERAARWQDFLPQYRDARAVGPQMPPAAKRRTP